MLQINFTGHHTDLTPALVNYTQHKFDKLERHFDKITSVNVIFDVEKLRQTAEATVLVSQGELHASAETQDMYNSVNELVEKLDRQLKKHKEKMRNHRE
jgi:putative sigma-54 modulation protein